jgi:5-methylcytosine-specific restriction enzyme subunit McrC
LHDGKGTPQRPPSLPDLQGAVQTYPVGPESCVGRTYNRLNADYEPMHALCRFFLENSGPTHERGDRSMFPFLVDMSRLYELFVA